MAELLSSGHVVDLIIALMVIEALVLLIWRRRLGHGIASGTLRASLLAGLCLLLALRGALTGPPGMSLPCGSQRPSARTWAI